MGIRPRKRKRFLQVDIWFWAPRFPGHAKGQPPVTPLRLLSEPLARSELAVLAQAGFGDMVKAVVDVRRGIMAIGGDLHSDEEALLLDDGSIQKDLWGINLYPEETGDDMVEFDSMINVRPNQGNRTRDVEDEATRKAIRAIVARLVTDAG